MLRIQMASNYGTSTPAIARTALQGRDILNFFQCSEEQKKAATSILFELQRHLLKCTDIRDQIETQVTLGQGEIRSGGFQLQNEGRSVTLPGVVDLQSKAEAYLQSAKLAISQIGNLPEPFYDQRFSHLFHKFSAWAKEKFGEDDQFYQTVHHWQPFVKRLVEMRNAVDHPSDSPGGKLETKNFDVARSSQKLVLLNPTWGLSGEEHSEVLEDLNSILEGIINLGEDVLTALFYKEKGDFPLAIQEIPIEKRDPEFPRRLIVGLP